MKFIEFILLLSSNDPTLNMSKLTLDSVTLVCIDGSANSSLSKQVFDQVVKLINFSEHFFSDEPKSLSDYNDFIINRLHQYIDTSHCLIIQYDGYPVNLSAWTNDFLSYDYIGAPWYTQPWPLDQTVGNGGFSLRSKKFLEESSKLNYDKTKDIPEDVFLCREKSSLLRDRGIKFAPHHVAYMFSVEDMYYKGQFGFHGKATFGMNKQVGIFR